MVRRAEFWGGLFWLAFGVFITWQGWLVFLAALALFACGAFLFPPQTMFVGYIVYEVAIVAALIFICQLKGEPTAWRWGKKK